MIEKFGNTRVEQTVSTDTKTGKTVGATTDNVIVTFDFQKRDDSQRAADNNLGAPPPKEQFVVDHEVGHVNRAITDPLGAATDTDREKPANDFAKTVADEKDTLSKEDAEKRVREILDLPPKEEKKKD